MNSFLVFVAIFSTAFAHPNGLLHDQDGHVSLSGNTLGTYKYSVHLKDSSRSEERLADGSVTGEYTVNDVNGDPQTLKYAADKNGFRVLSGPLPVAPVDANVGSVPVQETTHSIRSDVPVSVTVSSTATNFLSAGLILPIESENKADKMTFLSVK